MKIFLSSLENQVSAPYLDENNKIEKIEIVDYIIKKGIKMKYNLMSYYYLTKRMDVSLKIRDNTEEILIDSGAHSFQKGKKVDWDEYTKKYADFIKEFDRPNVIGYFEMDVDNIIGYEKVLELRKILEKVSDKIIPVWHKNRGIEDFKKMCQNYSGKIVAVTGFKNEDIQDHQYLMFVKYAHQHNCKIHCLGMTRKKILDKVPFDYTDSSSWVQSCVYGRMDGKDIKVTREYSKNNRANVFLNNYIEGMKLQNYYQFYWKNKKTVI